MAISLRLVIFPILMLLSFCQSVNFEDAASLCLSNNFPSCPSAMHKQGVCCSRGGKKFNQWFKNECIGCNTGCKEYKLLTKKNAICTQ